MIQFTTRRLRVRTLHSDDAARISEYRSDVELARYVPWEPPYLVEKATEMIAGSAGLDFDNPGSSGLIMAVETISDGSLIGDAMIRHDAGDARQAVIGYVVAPEFQGQGYATELARGLIGRFFAHSHAHRVSAWCDARNAASIRVLEKSGMRCEAEFIQGMFIKGEWVDERVYAMLASEWSKRIATPDSMP